VEWSRALAAQIGGKGGSGFQVGHHGCAGAEPKRVGQVNWSVPRRGNRFLILLFNFQTTQKSKEISEKYLEALEKI
jgi:hypothetical protein